MNASKAYQLAISNSRELTADELARIPAVPAGVTVYALKLPNGREALYFVQHETETARPA